MQNLLIATTNKGKFREFSKLLSELPINIISLNDFAPIPEVEETGTSFAENAQLKASYYALKTNQFALADDSGLEVEVLNNAPGVYSARYAGNNASDTDNINKLLLELKKIDAVNRKARFVCEMAISDKNGQIIHRAKEICNGKITPKPFGHNGFGYDPIFIPSGYSETFGQISDETKQLISHRSKAVKKIIENLSQFLSS